MISKVCAVFSLFQLHAAWCRNAGCQEDFFRDSFVHRHCTAQIAGSGIRDAAQIEVRLYSSVFSIGSVKCHEDHIRCLTQLDHTRTEEFSSACYRILYLIVKAADIRCLRIYIIISVKSSGRICTFLTEKYIHKNRLMSLRTKCLTHICSRYNRNLTFCAGSSCQYYNLHLFSPTLSFQTYFSQSPFPVTD